MPSLPHPLHPRQNLPRDAYQPGLILAISLGCFFGLLALVALGLLLCCGPSVFILTPHRRTRLSTTDPDPDLEGSTISHTTTSSRRSTAIGAGGIDWMGSVRRIFTMSAQPPPSDGASSVASLRARRRPRGRVRYVRPEMSGGGAVAARIVNLSGVQPSGGVVGGKRVRVKTGRRTTATVRKAVIPEGTKVVEARPDGDVVLDARHPDEEDGRLVVNAEPSEDGVVEAVHPDERRRPSDLPTGAGAGGWRMFGGRT